MNGLLQILGWMIPISLGQAALVAGGVWLAFRTVPRERVRLRHGIAVVALAIVGTAFVATAVALVVDWKAHVACWSRPATEVPLGCAAHGVHVPALERPGAPAPKGRAVLDWIPDRLTPDVPGARALAVRWTPGAGAVGVLWLLALIPIGVREVRGRRALRAAVDDATAVGGEATATLAGLVGELGIRTTVRIRETPAIGTPCVSGWRRPVVLLPLGLVRALGRDELRGVLAHELAHVRRLDAITAGASRLAERTLFFNPFLRWIADRVRDEREAACDRVGAEVGACSRRNYAEALLVLEGFRAIPSGAGRALPLLGEGDLVGRVRRLLAEPLVGRRSLRRVALAVVLMTTLVAGAATLTLSGATLGSWAIMTTDLHHRDTPHTR